MGGLSGTEQRAQRAFERQVLGCVLTVSPDGGAAAEQVEQAIGYYRHAADGNPVQQLLGRRFRGAVAALQAQGLLDPAVPPETYRLTPAARARVLRARRWPWWGQLLAVTRSQ